MKLNKNYLKLKSSYLFSDIAQKVAAYRAEHPDRKIISLGIGDVTQPLTPAVIEAMHRAVGEMARAETFRGYGPEQGYVFLREAIQSYYTGYGVKLGLDEIFVSDGAKSDLGNILDLFSKENVVLIPDPVYPVYVDTNIMDGRKIVYMKATEDNGCLPMPDELTDTHADIIYICSPNNPTGAVYTRDQLAKWVSYAIEQNALILFDAAYEAFISDENCPHSIYEINGAEKCAIEFCSLSKSAGFTGTRLGYTVVPHTLAEDGGMSLNKMWLRRQTTKFNGVSYVVQRAAEAHFSPEGQKQSQKLVGYYKENAKILMQALDSAGISYTGGKNSPYLWMRCPYGMQSWTYFDKLLHEAQVVGTPGAGFGEQGEGYFRLTAFGSREDALEASQRIKSLTVG